MVPPDSARADAPHLVGDDLTPDARERYSRQIVLPGFGPDAQRALAASRVLVIGAGGLGSAIVPALAATGVGTIGVLDPDVVELSNLHRQTAHGMSDVGRLKVDSMADTVAEIDPDIRFIGNAVPFDVHNAERILRDYDVVIDGSDNFATRYLSSDAAVLASIPLVWGAVLRYDGQVGVSWPTGPTYRDLFPTPPDPDDVLDCAVGGVLPSVCSVIGGLVVAEVVKLITAVGTPLVGRMLAYDARTARVREVPFESSPDTKAVIGLTDDVYSAGGLGEREDAVATVTAGFLLSRLSSAHPPVLVDVRTPEERALRSLPDALCVPMDELERRSLRLPEHAARLAAAKRDGAEVVVVCTVGVRSRRAVLALAEAGAPGLSSLDGGILALDAALAAHGTNATDVEHDDPVVLATISEEPLDESAVRDAVGAESDGAVVVFLGVVRNHDGGRRVTALEYSAHPDAERFLYECCRRVADATGLRVAASHRVGELAVGDVALIAAVASAHRAEAFKACAELVDDIKAGVPIWKRQRFDDGTSEWVGLDHGSAGPASAAMAGR
ncbi:hypothetical protein GCM10027568_25730 [Humibacter soli]